MRDGATARPPGEARLPGLCLGDLDMVPLGCALCFALPAWRQTDSDTGLALVARPRATARLAALVVLDQQRSPGAVGLVSASLDSHGSTVLWKGIRRLIVGVLGDIGGQVCGANAGQLGLCRGGQRGCGGLRFAPSTHFGEEAGEALVVSPGVSTPLPRA